MDYDSSAYVMFHAMNVEWPCMSFDVVRDSLGVKRTQVWICAPRPRAAAPALTPAPAPAAQLPMTAYIAAGSQASEPEQNSLYVMRLSDLHRTIFDEDEDVDEEDSDIADEEANVEVRKIPHRGAVNRIRVRAGAAALAQRQPGCADPLSALPAARSACRSSRTCPPCGRRRGR